jgi:hypothetical protein
MLDGIPNFYYRYDYTDMFDVSTHDINYSAIMTLPASSYSVRAATLEDAAAVQALYNRHYGSYTGSFVRSLEMQRHRLEHRRPPGNPLWLAFDSLGKIKGYLSTSGGQEQAQALEMAADDWEATVALLQYHGRLLDGPEAPAFLSYRLPSDGTIVQELIDRLQVPDTSRWHHPSVEWGVRCQMYHHRFAGWMARLIHLSTLARELLPEWQTRWKRSLVCWSGDLQLAVGEETCLLRMDGDELLLIDGPGLAPDVVRLTPQQFIQALFGYRSVAAFLRHDGQPVADDLLTVLNVLFPTGHTWIPSSDWF